MILSNENGGCIFPPVLLWDEHDFTNDELRLFQKYLGFCLQNRNNNKRRPKKYNEIHDRYFSFSEDTRNLILNDARKLETYEYNKKVRYDGPVSNLKFV